MTMNPDARKWRGSHDRQSIWDADIYDSWFDEPRGARLFRLEARAALQLISRGQTVLEVGCGTGRFLAALAAEGAAAAGVDPDPGMVEFAKRRGGAVVAQARAEYLPFPDARFDATLAVTVLEFVDDAVSAVEEMARVTRSGGRIVVGFLNPRSLWGLGLLQQRRQEPWRSARFFQRRELGELLAQYGRTEIAGVPLCSETGLAPGRVAGGGRSERTRFGSYCGFQIASCVRS